MGTPGAGNILGGVYLLESVNLYQICYPLGIN